MKRCLAFFLACCIIMSLVGGHAFAQEVTIVESGSCGANVSYMLYSDGLLSITGTGAMRDYHVLGDGSGDTGWFYSKPWDDSISIIENIIIGDGVTHIGSLAFEKCTSLTSVTIPDSVITIGRYAFLDCKSLTSVTLSDNVTSIAYSAFYGCTSLTSFTIPNGITSIETCSFSGCTSLASITIPNSVTAIKNHAFENCSSLTNIKIPDSVQTIEQAAFRGCASLTSVTIPNSVVSIGGSAFEDCSSLARIMIPDSVSFIGGDALYNTAYYNYPSNWENGVLYNGNHLIAMEISCSGVYTIKDGTKNIGDSAFKGCSSLTSIAIPNSVTSIGASAFEGCSSLTSIAIPNGVTSIERSAFYGCSSLTSIAIPNSVTSIGASAFEGCSSLTSIAIPNSVTSIGASAFEGCSSLTSIAIPNGVTSIERSAFYRCTSLTSITISNGVTSIGGTAFQYSSLANVYYSGTEEQWNAISIGLWNDELTSANIFYNCKERQFSVKVVDSVTGKPLKNAEVMLGSTLMGVDKNGIRVINYPGPLTESLLVNATGYDPQLYFLEELNTKGMNTIQLKKSVKHDDQDVGEDDGSSDVTSPDISFEGLEFGPETIYGPTIDFIGKSFPLFSTEIGMDFTNIPGLDNLSHIGTANNVFVDRKTQTIKIMLGIGEGYQAQSGTEWNEDYAIFKDYYRSYHKNASAKDILNKHNKIRDKLSKLGSNIVFDCDAMFCGYIELDYSTGKTLFKEGGVVLVAEGKVSTDLPLSTLFYATFEVGGSAEMALSFTPTASGSVSLGTQATLKFTPSMGAGARILDKDILSVEIGLQGEVAATVTLPADSLEDALLATLQAQLYIRARLLGENKTLHTNFPGVKLYPDFGEAVSLLSLEEGCWEEISREYLNSPSISTYGLSDMLMEQNVYPYAAPKLASLSDGRVMALWIKDDGTKTDYNRTTLYYSICENGFWSTPTVVAETNVADYDPQVAVDGDNVHVLWQRASKVYEGEYDVTEAMKCTELVYSVYENGAFSAPQIVAPAGNFQTSYSIAAQSGMVYAAWADIDDYEYETVYGAELGMEEIYPEYIMSGYVISNVASGFEYGMPTVACAASESFEDDGEIYINGYAITDNDTEDAAISYQNDTFYWLDDDSICVYEHGENVDTGVKCDDLSYRVLADYSIAFAVSDGFKNELYIAYSAENGYPLPVKLTSYDMHISSYDVLYVDGNVMTFACVEEMTDYEGATSPYGATHIICETQNDYVDIALGDAVIYDEQLVSVGQTVSFNAEITNNGKVTVNEVEATLIDENGQLLAISPIAVALRSGESTTVTLDYVIPEDFSLKNVTMMISTEEDSQTENNSLAFTIGRANLVVTDCAYDNGLISGTIANRGYDVAQDVVLTVTHLGENEDETVEVIEIGTIKAGERVSINQAISSEFLCADEYYKADAFVVSISTTSAESYLSDNDQKVLVELPRVTAVTLNTSKFILYQGRQCSLQACVQPENAFEKGVMYLSDNLAVATVDENGIVIAKSLGTATITAISVDGDYTTSCTVTVTEVMQGDLNFDYVLDTTDARLALRGIIELEELTEEQWQMADVNQDGKVDSSDVRRMLQTCVS